MISVFIYIPVIYNVFLFINAFIYSCYLCSLFIYVIGKM